MEETKNSKEDLVGQEIETERLDSIVEIEEVDLSILDAFQIPHLKEIDELQNVSQRKLDKAK